MDRRVHRLGALFQENGR